MKETGMRIIVMAGAALLALGSGQALAQLCSSGPSQRTFANLQTMLPNNCACGTSGSQSWNETHNGADSGQIWERGTTIGALSAANSIGTYQISDGGGGLGIVAYTYGATTYTYSIAANNATVPQTVTFCQRNNASPFATNGTTYSINLKVGQCPPFPC